MKTTIYHNPRCRKSREALQLLLNAGCEPEIIEYLKNPIERQNIRAILDKMKCHPLEIVRKVESIYKEKFKSRDYSVEEWIEILHEYPILIERPIVIKGDKAIVARPPENVRQLL